MTGIRELAISIQTSRTRRSLRAASRCLYGALVPVSRLLLVLLTIYVVTGRLLIPQAGDYRADIETALESLLGGEVQIASLEGRWDFLSPEVIVEGLRLTPAGGASPLAVERLAFRLDVFRSLMNRQLSLGGISIAGLGLELREQADDRWRVQGIGSGDGLNNAHLDLLLNIRDLHMTDARLRLRRADGQLLELENVQASLHNGGGRHELNLLLSLPDQPNPLQLSLTLQGDPRDAVAMDGYLSLRQTDMMPVLAMLAPELPLDIDRLNGDARLWFSRQADGQLSSTLELERVNFTLEAVAGQSSGSAAVQALSTTLRLQSTGAGRWQLDGYGLDFRQQGRDWQEGPFRVIRRPAAGESPATVDLMLDSLQLDPLNDWLGMVSEVLPGSGVIRTLSPRGRVEQLTMRLHTGDSPRFFLRADLRDVGVDAWQHAPAGEGVDARVEVSESAGVARIDSRNTGLHLEQIFADRWDWSRIQGQVYWELFEGGFRVFSSPLAVRNDHLEATVQFEVDRRMPASAEPVSDLGLNIGVERMDARFKGYFLPLIEYTRGTMDWLEVALQGGDLYDSGFIFRGSTRADPPPGSQTTLAWFQGENLSLSFHPDWPVVEQADADVRLRNHDVDVRVGSAGIDGLSLSDVSATVRREGGVPRLALQGSGRGDTGAALDFLRDTPVRQTTGDVLDDWEASGEVTLEIGLGLPLSGELSPRIDLSVDSRGSRLQMHDLGLDIEALEGRVTYHTDTGLSAEALDARIFDRPVTARIETEPDESGVPALGIHARGTVAARDLEDWSGQTGFIRGVLGFAEGEAPYTLDLQVYREHPEGRRAGLDIRSQLDGIALDLPEPLVKTAEEARDFRLGIDFFGDRNVVQLDVAEDIAARLMLVDGEVQGGRLWLGGFRVGDVAPSVRWRPQNFVVLGDLETLDVGAWQAVLQSFREEASTSPALLDRLSLAEVNVGTLVFGDQVFDETLLRVTPAQGGWSIFIENELFSGLLEMPAEAGMPWLASLHYLRLPGGDGGAEEMQAPQLPPEDPLADLDPRELPPVDVTLAEFRQGERNFGRWEFSMRPGEEGLLVEDLRVTMADARITGVEESAPGAVLEWRYDGERHRSRFNGRIEAGNLAGVLTSLGYDAHIESQSARFTSDLTWPGSPAAFALTVLDGGVMLRIDDGRFVNIDSGSSRLFGALNLDSLVRRLQLDFSDIFGRGLSYDRIDGNLGFDSGRLSTRDRVLISGPSSKIRLEGELDLIRQFIEADMLVSVPISQNISVLAGLLGAWPIALSTYLAGRIFEDQVEGLTAVVYHLEGPLNDLDAEFVDADELDEVDGEPVAPAEAGNVPQPSED